MRKVIKRICNAAENIVVRNEESKAFLVNRIHIPADRIAVTSDYAQILVDHPIPTYAPLEAWKSPHKKQILLHINELKQAHKVIIPALKKFYLENPEQYEIVVASDQHYDNDGQTFAEIKKFAGEDAYYYSYGDNPMELCSVIQSCDCVLTYKLHVGIVAAAYSKSVIPIPQHYKKVQKYYNQIGHGERVLPLKDATIAGVFDLITKYINAPIVLSEEIYEKARQNDLYLDEFIRKHQDEVLK
jgi:exopolysaccharide biosynthesis predicted pyruvyltransferase EpsI